VRYFYDMDKIKIGMIGLVESDGSFSNRTIEKMQLKEGFAPEDAIYSHVFISGGEKDEVSSSFPYIKRRTIDAYKGRRIKWVYLKDKNFREAPPGRIPKRGKFAFFCASEMNKPYPVQALAWWLLPNWLRGSSNWLTRNWAKFCSFLADWGLKMVHFDVWVDSPENVTVPARFSAASGPGDDKPFEVVDCLLAE